MMVGMMIMLGMLTLISIAADEPTIVSSNFDNMSPMIRYGRG